MADDLKRIAENISAELRQRFPEQRKTQRNKLSLLVATMLDVRSANLMDLRRDCRWRPTGRICAYSLGKRDELLIRQPHRPGKLRIIDGAAKDRREPFGSAKQIDVLADKAAVDRGIEAALFGPEGSGFRVFGRSRRQT
jgi:hypothetical protein